MRHGIATLTCAKCGQTELGAYAVGMLMVQRGDLVSGGEGMGIAFVGHARLISRFVWVLDGPRSANVAAVTAYDCYAGGPCQ
jgi:hypothetical protein